MDIGSFPILSLITFLPLLGALVIAIIPRNNLGRDPRAPPSSRPWPRGSQACGSCSGYDPAGAAGAGFQYVETLDWIPLFGIQYKVGVDGLSVAMVVLTTTLTWISILASISPIKERVKEYMISFLILEVGMLGVFVSLDLFLFYIFWEVVLVPMYLIIGIWGGANRIYATIKFVLYTLVGSLLMLVAILATAFAYQAATGSWDGAFDLQNLAGHGFDRTFQLFAFAAFALAFAIKVPMFPFHTWLPDAHVEAPTAGSVILAGVLLKLGAYGFIRFALPIFPEGAHAFAPLIIVLSVIAIIYGAIVALVQPDLKKLVAYSSVSHMGFVTLGIFIFQEQGMQGAILQMVNHGLITGALFLLVGVIYERTHDRTIAKMGGLGGPVPGLLGGPRVLRLRLGRPARPGRVRRRVPGLRRHLRLQPVDGRGDRLRDDLRRRLPALDAAARPVRPAVRLPAGARPPPDRHAARGDPDAGAAGRPHRRLRPLPGPAPRPRRRVGPDRPRRRRPVARDGDRALTGAPPMSTADLLVIAPLIAAVLVAAAIIVADLIKPGDTVLATGVSLLGVGIVAALVVWVGATPGTAFGGSYRVDALATFLDLLFVAIVGLTILFGPDYLVPRGLPVAEFAAILVFALTGAMLIAGSADLLVLFLGLELMVIPGYLLAGFHKRDALSTEGAIKYFLLGSFSSAIFLFGLAFVWGLTGSTRIADVAAQLALVVQGQAALSAGLAMGLAFLTTGVAFKIAAVPFHYWTPDAYQGSPTPITGYLSVGPKIGAFAVILRVFAEALAPLREEWLIVFFVLATLTMTLGNLVALTQDNVKRMLAYSSIAHTGYMLVGLAAYADGQIEGLEGLLFYSAAYTFMNLGAFAVISALQRRPGVTSRLETFAGLGRREPALGILMVLFLLSLTGIPPTAGFFGKAYVILAAVEAGGWMNLLAVIAVLNAAVAAFYYLRVVVYMYMREPQGEQAPVGHGALLRLGLAITAVMTVTLGLFPGPLLESVGKAAAAVGAALP